MRNGRMSVLASLVLLMTILVGASPAAGQFHEFDPEALKAFEEVVKAYRARPALTVNSAVKIAITQNDVDSAGPEVKAEFTLGKDRRVRARLQGFTCYIGDGVISATHEGTDHSYFSTPDDDAPLYSLMMAFQDLPFPHLAVALGDDDVEMLCMEFHQKAPYARPTGVSTVEKDGQSYQEIRFTSDFDEMSVLVDPQTKLMHGIELKISGGISVQPGATLKYIHTFKYDTHEDGLQREAFEFRPGERQRVDMMASLMPAAPPAAPGGRGGGGAMPAGDLVGQKAPALLLATVDGGAVDIEELRSQVVVLDFWASWCRPCRAALPALHDVARWVDDEALPVKVITVNVFERKPNVEDTPEARIQIVKDVWAEEGFSLPVAMDFTDEVAAAYGVEGIPATIVIRADGVVHAQHAGAGANYAALLKADIRAALDALERDGN